MREKSSRVLRCGRTRGDARPDRRARGSELRRWAQEWPASARQINDVVTLKAMSLPLLEPDQAIARIREWADIHRKIYEEYKAIQAQFLNRENGKLKDGLGIYLTLLRGLTFEKSHLDWCAMAEGAITATQRKRPPRSRHNPER